MFVNLFLVKESCMDNSMGHSIFFSCTTAHPTSFPCKTWTLFWEGRIKFIYIPVMAECWSQEILTPLAVAVAGTSSDPKRSWLHLHPPWGWQREKHNSHLAMVSAFYFFCASVSNEKLASSLKRCTPNSGGLIGGGESMWCASELISCGTNSWRLAIYLSR